MIDRVNMSSLLFSVVALGCTLLLTAAQTPSQCGQARCPSPLPTMGWISNIMAPQRSATFARLSWAPDPNLMEGRSYNVVWREFNTEDSFTDTRGPEHPMNTFNLMNLQPGTRYEALVCLPRFNITDLPANTTSDSLSLPDCGFCSVCFRTFDVFFEFMLTESSRVSEAQVNLTCQIESNVDFNIEWRVEVLDEETGEIRRERLNPGELFDMEPIEISQHSVVIEEGSETIVTSELIISNSIFEMPGVECRARSMFGNSPPSMPGAFEPVDPFIEPANQTVPFPVWAIALMIVLPILIITFLVILIAAICILLMRKKNKIIKLEDAERRRYKKSNTYLERIIGVVKVPDEKPLNSEAITALNGAIPEDMIIDSSLVNVSTVIGQGEFGVVYKGLLKKGGVDEVVAVKSLKGIFVTENDVQNALQEILKMKNYDHPNVMTLIGVCRATGMSGGAPSIIMPYMARGSLLSYLRKERDQLLPGPDADVTQVGAVQKLLMQICLQISKGMAYLASLRFVHRDLAARNCMIDEKGVIKVSDFGLAEDIYMRNYFRQSAQDTAVKLPLKWMAPESIKLGIFSEKSDVWAYGVTCWEVFTAGEIPYPGVHPQEVVQMLEDGQHLNRPKNQACCDTMFGIMQSCWSYRPEDRPEFEELVSSLNSELTALAEYVDLSMFAEESNVNTASEE